MTQTLKKQLTALCVVSLCGSALVWNKSALRAQEEGSPRQKLTRDEAAKEFVNELNDGNVSFSRFFEESSSISLKSQRDFGKDAPHTNSNAAMLFRTMIVQWQRPNQTIQVQTEGDKTATVIVQNDPTPPARPLVLIEEDGGWGVDLVETYAKWNSLEGAAKAEAIYKLTGVMLDDLPRNEEFTRRICQTNLKQISLGLLQYFQDYDEKMPPAKPWIDVLQPYVRSEAIFNCPSLPKSRRYGYAYNSKLSDKNLELLSNASRTVSVYETSVLKRNAYGVGENRAFRHQGGANYAFADGHAKWFPKSESPSFKLKP